MWGGPSHLDTFDPKPAAGYDYCGPLEQADSHERRRRRHQRTAPAAGAAGGQVLDHPQHDARHQRARDGVVRGADRPQVRAGTTCIPSRRRGRVAVQGLQRGLQRTDSAVHRADAAARPVFRGRVPRAALTRPSRRAAIRRRRGSWSTGVVAQNITDQRQRDRRELLRQLNTIGDVANAGASLDAFTKSEEQAYDLILGDAGKVFDLSLRRRTRCATATGATRSGSRAWRRGGSSSAACRMSPSTTTAGTRTSRTSR